MLCWSAALGWKIRILVIKLYGKQINLLIIAFRQTGETESQVQSTMGRVIKAGMHRSIVLKLLFVREILGVNGAE